MYSQKGCLEEEVRLAEEVPQTSDLSPTCCPTHPVAPGGRSIPVTAMTREEEEEGRQERQALAVALAAAAAAAAAEGAERAQRTWQGEPDPTRHEPQEVSWWSLLAKGFEVHR